MKFSSTVGIIIIRNKHKSTVLMPKTSEPSPRYPEKPEFIPGNEAHSFTVDINSRPWCSYCKRNISVKTFGQHFSNMCQWAVVASGRDWDKVKTSRNTTRRQSDKKRYQKIDNVVQRNKTRWLAEFAKSHPPPVPPPKIPIFWDLPSIHPFYWDKEELPEFEDHSLRQEFHAKLAEPLRKVIETHSTFLNDVSEFKKLTKEKKRDKLMDLSNAFRKCRGIIGKSFRTT